MQTMTSPQLDLLHEIAFEILFSLSIKIFLNNFFSPLSLFPSSLYPYIRVLHIYLVLPSFGSVDWLLGWLDFVVTVRFSFFLSFRFIFVLIGCSEELKLLMEDDADDDYEPPAN